MVEPFRISVSEREITHLKEKLSSTDFPDELDDTAWQMGVPVSSMKRLIARWKDGFDWRISEEKLNELPQYVTAIEVEGLETLQIHFVHQRSSVAGAIPLLFCHGWPGSFFEVEKILPLLTKPASGDSVAFHVVAPSLPNFGFSEGTKKRGFGLGQYAEVCHKLMLRLGYIQYTTQGGDWGFHITRSMGLLWPESCKASHLNYTECFPPSPWKQPLLWLHDKITPYSAHERAGLKRTADHEKNGKGYDIEQQTKPQTISCALADSPAALLAWIYEKLHEWTDAYPWTDDEILTWVSIYWFSTAGPAASTRIYYEATHAREGQIGYERPMEYIPFVKYGISHFPMDIFVNPNTWAATLGDVVLQTRQPRGGHFAATEEPSAIVADLQTMFRKGGKAYGCVDDCDGYQGD